MNPSDDLLVVGAGPTGLALALQAHACGARVRIVDRRTESFRHSRALILHPRTLEVLRPLGVTDAILARADTAPDVDLHLGHRVIPVNLDQLHLPDTAFPHLTLVRQMDVESVLTQALAARGIAVEWGTELTSVRDEATAAHATLRSRSGMQTTAFGSVVGCDGPCSTVRRAAGIAWSGGPYQEEIVLADVELAANLDDGAVHLGAGREGLALLFALGEHARWRLLVTRGASGEQLVYGAAGPPVAVDDLQPLVDDAGLDARITCLAWSARYHLQHRLAARFRQGRLFLAGDAAHAYSPATGQGMNTGIQDALNLGWKLAFAGTATDRNALLDSYEQERRPVVRRALVITHLAFWAEASAALLPSWLRGVVAPLGAPLIPHAMGQPRLVGETLQCVSQLRAAYPHTPVSREDGPRLAGGSSTGQRLPDATVTTNGDGMRLHALTTRPGVHVLLHRDAAPLEQQEFGPHVTCHRLTSRPGPGVVVVRPDGYVGYRCGVADTGKLRSWLSTIGAGSPQPPVPPNPCQSS